MGQRLLTLRASAERSLFVVRLVLQLFAELLSALDHSVCTSLRPTASITTVPSEGDRLHPVCQHIHQLHPLTANW